MTGVPSFSMGEIDALVLKAYRGAGFSWGMAQEAGKAACWLTAAQLPALDAFAMLLQQIDSTPHMQLVPDIKSTLWPARWCSGSGVLCPVVAGTLLSDTGPAIAETKSTLLLESVAAPLILLPFAASLGEPVTITATGLEVCVHGDATEFATLETQVVNKSDVTLEMSCHENVSTTIQRRAIGQGNDGQSLIAPASRGTAEPASIEFLESLAYRTYVPATQASRETGAGAGLNDDD